MKLTFGNMFPWLTALALLIALAAGCTDKGTGSDLQGNQNIDLRVRLNSTAAEEQVDLFILTATARDMDRVIDTLILIDGEIAGEIEVPVGQDRRFELVAYHTPPEGGPPQPIYRGVTITDVLPGQEVQLVIDMQPVVPMVRLSPRYTEMESGGLFHLDIEVANIPGVAGVNILLDLQPFNYSINPLKVDHHSTQPGSVVTTGQLEYDGLRYRVIAIDSTARSMVNSDGNGLLATVTFATEGFVGDIATMGNISIFEMVLANQELDSIPTVNIMTDHAELILTSQTDRVLTFPDAALLDAVLAASQATTPPIYYSDVQYMSYFDAVEYGVQDWTGLGQLTNLQTLYLSWNNAPDLSPLAPLVGLYTLECEGNDVVDISPLSNLIGLTNLSLYWNQVVDVTPLSDLTELQTLDLSSNNIVNIAPLAPLWKLGTLQLGDNEITDISALSNLRNLSVLGLENNFISDIAPLVANDGLGTGDRIDLSGNPLDDPLQQQLIGQLIERGVTVVYGT